MHPLNHTKVREKVVDCRASGRKEGANTAVSQSQSTDAREGRRVGEAHSPNFYELHLSTHPVVLCGEARETLAEPLARLAALLRLHADLVPAARVEIVDAAHAVDGDLLGRGRGLLCLALGH